MRSGILPNLFRTECTVLLALVPFDYSPSSCLLSVLRISCNHSPLSCKARSLSASMGCENISDFGTNTLLRLDSLVRWFRWTWFPACVVLFDYVAFVTLAADVIEVVSIHPLVLHVGHVHPREYVAL